MCLGFVRYSVRVSCHSCYISITLMCYPSRNCLAPLTSQNPCIECSFPSIFIVRTVQSVVARSLLTVLLSELLSDFLSYFPNLVICVSCKHRSSSCFLSSCFLSPVRSSLFPVSLPCPVLY